MMMMMIMMMMMMMIIFGEAKDTKEERKVGNVLFNDALNTFYLRLYGVGRNNDKGSFR